MCILWLKRIYKQKKKKPSCFGTGKDVGNTKCQIIFFSNICDVCIFSETLNDLTKKDKV